MTASIYLTIDSGLVPSITCSICFTVFIKSSSSFFKLSPVCLGAYGCGGDGDGGDGGGTEAS